MFDSVSGWWGVLIQTHTSIFNRLSLGQLSDSFSHNLTEHMRLSLFLGVYKGNVLLFYFTGALPCPAIFADLPFQISKDIKSPTNRSYTLLLGDF